MWALFQPPASSLRHRIYSDGKRHTVSELWRRWNWLAIRVLAGLLTLEFLGVVCFAISRARWLQSIGFVLMVVPVILLSIVAVAAVAALAVALFAGLRQWMQVKIRDRRQFRSR
jgi:hypothetical protein